MTIVEAQTQDHKKLTQITMLSKNHWGYGAKQIELWTEDLTISSDYIATHQVFKLLDEDELVAYYSYFFPENGVCMLDNLFILPTYIGKGLGKLLMNDFFARVQDEHIDKFSLVSDPHAETFYEQFGFVSVDKKESSIPERYLPVMEKDIKTIQRRGE